MVSHCQPYYYGISEIEFDTKAIEHNKVIIKHCKGIFPDGTPFSFPSDNSPPPARSCEEFVSDNCATGVYLSLPFNFEEKSIVCGSGYETNSFARFKSQNVDITDEVYGVQQKKIEIGELNLCLQFSTELMDNYTSLQIAQLQRTPYGTVKYSENFIPPLLKFGASEYLVNSVGNLLESLINKSIVLSQGRRELPGQYAQFSRFDDTAFHLLQTLNTYIPLLGYYHAVPISHPFDLFSAITMFAGSLSTFTAQISYDDFSNYNHCDLYDTFSKLYEKILFVLNLDFYVKCTSLQVDKVNNAVFQIGNIDTKLFLNSKFYLGVSANGDNRELVVGIIQRLKMCSKTHLDALISSSMPGLRLMHLINPPDEVMVKPGYVYFSIIQDEPIWSGIKESASVALYFPNNYDDLRIELIIIKN